MTKSALSYLQLPIPTKKINSINTASDLSLKNQLTYGTSVMDKPFNPIKSGVMPLATAEAVKSTRSAVALDAARHSTYYAPLVLVRCLTATVEAYRR